MEKEGSRKCEKKISQWISWIIMLAMVLQLGVPAFGEEAHETVRELEDGVTLTYNEDGTITATISATVPAATRGTRRVAEEPRLSDKGDSFIHETEDLRVIVEKTYTDGNTLATVEAESGESVLFYPETASGEFPVTNNTIYAIKPLHIKRTEIIAQKIIEYVLYRNKSNKSRTAAKSILNTPKVNRNVIDFFNCNAIN